MAQVTSTERGSVLSLTKFFEALPEVGTERLVLRKLGMGDAEAVYAMTREGEVSRYLSWTAHETLGEAKVFLKRFVEAGGAGRPAPWGVVERGSGRLVGTCGVIDAHPRHRWGQVSFGMTPGVWGKGYGTEALRAVIGVLFERTEVQRVEGLAHVENRAGRRVMEKAGMALEGVLRQNMFAKGGFHDLAVYSIVRQDVKEKRMEPETNADEHR